MRLTCLTCAILAASPFGGFSTPVVCSPGTGSGMCVCGGGLNAHPHRAAPLLTERAVAHPPPTHTIPGAGQANDPGLPHPPPLHGAAAAHPHQLLLDLCVHVVRAASVAGAEGRAYELVAAQQPHAWHMSWLLLNNLMPGIVLHDSRGVCRVYMSHLLACPCSPLPCFLPL
jgi:hypothetical protein